MLWVDNCLVAKLGLVLLGYVIIYYVYEMLVMIKNKITYFNRNMENHPRQQYNHSPHGSGLAN
jgi:hypothetical protein